jgi:hypothetical protein
MLPARPTILRVMYLTAVVALNVALVRDWYHSYNAPFSYTAVFPALGLGMADLLALSLDRAIFAGAERRAFARGFFLCGLVPFAAVALLCAVYTRREVIVALNPMLDKLAWERYVRSVAWLPGGRLGVALRPALVLAAMTSAFAVPQAAVASAGGAANLLVWRLSRRAGLRRVDSGPEMEAGGPVNVATGRV